MRPRRMTTGELELNWQSFFILFYAKGLPRRPSFNFYSSLKDYRDFDRI